MVLRSRTMGSTSTRYMMTATTRNTQTLKAARPIKASRCRERLSSLRCMARTHSSSSTRPPAGQLHLYGGGGHQARLALLRQSGVKKLLPTAPDRTVEVPLGQIALQRLKSPSQPSKKAAACRASSCASESTWS